MRSDCACALPSRDMPSMPAAPSSSASARGSSARPLSLSSSRLPARSKRRSDSSRSSSLTAELVADCDSAITALAAVVLPLWATATKICN